MRTEEEYTKMAFQLASAAHPLTLAFKIASTGHRNVLDDEVARETGKRFNVYTNGHVFGRKTKVVPPGY